MIQFQTVASYLVEKMYFLGAWFCVSPENALFRVARALFTCVCVAVPSFATDCAAVRADWNAFQDAVV